jgi:hypothetical protein
MKLFDEPRVDKEIKVPKKVTRKKKVVDDTVDKPKIKYTLLREGSKSHVNAFIELYKQDKLKARVKYFNGNNTAFSFSRLVLFEHENGDFEIANLTTKFGISITSKMYSTQSKNSAIIYKAKKFWYRYGNGKNIKPLTMREFQDFISSNENIHFGWFNEENEEKSEYLKNKFEKFGRSKVYEYMSGRFHWLKTLVEFDANYAITFTTVLSKKLFGLKSLYRHVYKVPYNVSKIVSKSNNINNLKRHSGNSVFAAWHEILKVLEHVDHLKDEMLGDRDFVDMCKMAKTLGRKINCKWGMARLKEEHDKWAREITNILLDCELEYELNIRPEFKAFAEYSGYKLLRTNKEMLAEGMIQNHCVGTYIDRVDRGDCAIYHVEGYTLQVTMGENIETVREMPEESLFGEGRVVLPQTKHVRVKYFRNSQFRGRHNESAPAELVKRVEAMMLAFKEDKMFDKIDENGYLPNHENRGSNLAFLDNMELPF